MRLTLSESYGRRVLVIDADLRRPSIHEVFGLDNRAGLAEGLRTGATGSLPVIQVSPTLTVLTAGTPDQRPMAGLTSERMASILKEAASRFDWVLLDTPPIGLISDAQLLSELVDGVAARSRCRFDRPRRRRQDRSKRSAASESSASC